MRKKYIKINLKPTDFFLCITRINFIEQEPAQRPNPVQSLRGLVCSFCNGRYNGSQLKMSNLFEMSKHANGCRSYLPNLCFLFFFEKKGFVFSFYM